MVENRENTR